MLINIWEHPEKLEIEVEGKGWWLGLIYWQKFNILKYLGQIKLMFNDYQVNIQFTTHLFFHLYVLGFSLIFCDLSFPNEMHCVLKEKNFFKVW